MEQRWIQKKLALIGVWLALAGLCFLLGSLRANAQTPICTMCQCKAVMAWHSGATSSP
jgi:hypothetical protein